MDDRFAARIEENREHLAVQAESVDVALFAVLETLTPDERLAFALHVLFAVPFDDIAPIIDHSPAATRRLVSRARRRLRDHVPADVPDHLPDHVPDDIRRDLGTPMRGAPGRSRIVAPLWEWWD